MSDVIRGLPWNEEAEKGVLSCYCQAPLFPGLLEGATMRPELEWFYHPAYQTIFSAILDFEKEGRPVDQILLTKRFMDLGLLEKIGGAGLLAEIFGFTPTPAHFPYYVGIMCEDFLKRSLIAACRKGIDRGYNVDQEVQDAHTALAETEADLFAVMEAANDRSMQGRQARPVTKVVGDWFDHLEHVYKNRGHILGLTTGLVEVDLTVNGLDDREGEIVGIAGRPGMGKTAALGTIVEHLVLDQKDRNGKPLPGVPGVVYSAEMSANQLFDRLVLGREGIDVSKATTGMFSRGEFEKIGKGMIQWQKAPLSINACASLNTSELRTEVQTMKRKLGIRWIAMDHLKLFKGVGKNKDEERLRINEVLETAQYLKKLGLVVFLLIQITRETDRKGATGNPPVLADLSGSGAIEEYLDHAWFLHRPVYYKPWSKLTDEAQDEWRTSHLEQRRLSPELWSDGSRCMSDENCRKCAGKGEWESDEEVAPCDRCMGKGKELDWAQQDYSEHALIFVRKNRRGPTPDLQVRYRTELTRFSSRRRKVYSNNAADRQLGYEEMKTK